MQVVFSLLPQKTNPIGISISVVSSNNESAIMLQHYRLGHPSFLYLEKLFPSLFKDKNPKFVQCEICQFSKLVRNTYPNQPYKASYPFSIIHIDIWWPSKVNNVSRARWFVSFVDDHRTTQIFLMKEKSKAGPIFQNFNSMVQTQIQVLRTNNAKEYFHSILKEYLLNNGIVHQSSCVDTSQQNRVAERKNKHLLKVIKSLMFTTHVPKHF